MRGHWAYLKYLLRHKWFVFWACLRLGIPWLGVVHDLSKFSRAEWRPYVLSWYSGWKEDERPQWVVILFSRALQHHVCWNRHHPEYWQTGDMILPMPDCYRREMLADWIGAGKAKRSGDPHWEGIEVGAWYQKHKDRIKLHPETREWIEETLE